MEASPKSRFSGTNLLPRNVEVKSPRSFPWSHTCSTLENVVDGPTGSGINLIDVHMESCVSSGARIGRPQPDTSDPVRRTDHKLDPVVIVSYSDPTTSEGRVLPHRD